MRQFSRHIHRRGAGFTLIEVMAAVLVMAIVLPSIMGGISLAINIASTAHRRSVATTLAEEKINELVVTGDWQNGSPSGDFADVMPGYTWQATVTDFSDTDLTTQNLEQLDVHVMWTNRGAQREIVLSTLIYNSSTTSTALPTGGL